MIIGQRLQERLNARGMSQAELGRRVKLNQSTINGLVHGDQQGTTEIHQIARELRTTPAYLSGETDDPEADAPDRPELGSEEREWLEMLQSLEPKDRAAVLTLTRSLARAPPKPTLHDHKQEFRRNGTDG